MGCVGALALRSRSGTTAAWLRSPSWVPTRGQSFAAQVTEALAAALRACGCPTDTAHDLATAARVEKRHGPWMLMLLGYGAELPREATDTGSAVDYLATNVAADNAQANDRAARGEAGLTPLWPLPNRKPRHRTAP